MQVRHALRNLACGSQQRSQCNLVVPLGAAAEEAFGYGLVQGATIAVLHDHLRHT